MACLKKTIFLENSFVGNDMKIDENEVVEYNVTLNSFGLTRPYVLQLASPPTERIRADFFKEISSKYATNSQNFARSR